MAQTNPNPFNLETKALDAFGIKHDATEKKEEDTSSTTSMAAMRPGETELADWVQNLYAESERYRREVANEDAWDTWLDAFNGETWTGSVPSFKPPVSINLLQTRMLQEVSDLTDTPIKVFVQKDRTKGDRDEKVEKAIQAYWHREFVDQEIMLAALDAMIFPCGFLGVTFDPNGDFGRGRLIVKARDPRTVYPDPDATSDDDWRYVILKDVFDLVEIRARWIDQGWRVRPDELYSVKIAGNEQVHDKGRSPTGLSGRYKGPLYAGGFTGLSEGYSKARAAVLSCFIYDDAIEEDIEERLNELTNEKVLISRKVRKYPHGRLIQVSNGVILYDGPSPYLGRFPVIRIVLQPTVHNFWPPQSVVGGVTEIYRAANKLDSMVVENGIRLNAGELIADASSGIDPAKYSAIPGQVLLINPGSKVQKAYPPPMPPDMIQGGKRLRDYADEVLGFMPSRIGAGQRGNVSPELTETEISQAMGITRLRARLLHNSVQKLVEVVFAGMARFYTQPRILPHTNGDKWEPVTWDPILAPEAYAAHVDQSSFSVKSKTMMQRLYFTLAKMKLMPIEETLQMLEIPNASETAKKLLAQLQAEALAGYNKLKRKK